MSQDPYAVPEQPDPSLDDEGRPKCTVCRRDDVALVDAAVRAGKSQRALARDLLGSPTWPALGRHIRNGHVTRTLELTGEEPEPEGGVDLAALKARVVALLEAAEARGSASAAINAARELRQVIALEEKANPGTITTVSYVDDPSWLETRDQIVEALTPYPQAREAVVQALTDAEPAPASDQAGGGAAGDPPTSPQKKGGPPRPPS